MEGDSHFKYTRVKNKKGKGEKGKKGEKKKRKHFQSHNTNRKHNHILTV